MANEELIAWIKFTIGIEEKGLAFYEACYEKIKDARAQELFSFLIEEEKRHAKLMLDLLKIESGGDEKLVEKCVSKFSATADTTMFNKEELDSITNKNTLVMEIFNRSAEQERKGIDTYLDLEQKIADPAIKKFFHDIAMQEVVHKHKIVSLGMSLFGMEEEDAPKTAEEIEKELKASKTVMREVKLNIKKCAYEPDVIKAAKGETVVLRINSDSPSGIRMINFGVDEYIRPNNELVVKFKADTAGEFEFFSNVPCSLGNSKLRGRFIVEGENEDDEDL